MIADPLTKLHCCIRSDGGGAVVLTAEDRVADCRKAPVWVLGTGEHASHTTMSEWSDFTRVRPPCRARWRSSGPASRPPTSTCARSTTRSRPWCCHARGPRLLREGRGRSVRRRRQAPPRRRAADEHRRRRSVGLPPRHARPVPARRGDAAAPRERLPDARPAGARRRARVRHRHRRLVLRQRHGHPRNELTA